MFSRMWTLLYVPSVTLPVAKGGSGLPIGVQIIGKPHEDNALISDAQWVYGRLK